MMKPRPHSSPFFHSFSFTWNPFDPVLSQQSVMDKLISFPKSKQLKNRNTSASIIVYYSCYFWLTLPPTNPFDPLTYHPFRVVLVWPLIPWFHLLPPSFPLSSRWNQNKQSQTVRTPKNFSKIKQNIVVVVANAAAAAIGANVVDFKCRAILSFISKASSVVSVDISFDCILA